MRHFLKAAPVLLLTMVATGSIYADVYRSVDEQGNVTYTNQAAAGAERIELKPLSVYGAPDLKPVVDNTIDNSPAAPKYKSVAIISPKADETLRDNPGNITVTAGSEPVLDRAAGHRFQFFLDGAAIGEPQVAVTKAIENVDRGEHQVGVAVVDAIGKLLMRSEPTRFFLHRQTIFNPARKKTP